MGLLRGALLQHECCPHTKHSADPEADSTGDDPRGVTSRRGTGLEQPRPGPEREHSCAGSTILDFSPLSCESICARRPSCGVGDTLWRQPELTGRQRGPEPGAARLLPTFAQTW